MPTQYAYTVFLAVCLTVCLYSIPQYAYSQYPRHRTSLNSKFHNLTSQNKNLNHFMTSFSENFLVCLHTESLHTVCLHSIPHSMPHSMLTQFPSVCLHTVSHTQTLTYHCVSISQISNYHTKKFLTNLLENCFLICLHAVCLHRMTHIMPHSMLIQYVSVCLHTLSYIE